MSKVCVGCGLTTDSDGNLIPNVGTAYATTYTAAACATAGSPISCGTDGVLRGAPEKFNVGTFNNSTAFQSTGSPEPLDNFDFGDGLRHDMVTDPASTKGISTVTVTNPSTCLSMAVFFNAGIHHLLFTKSPNTTGDTNVRFGTSVTVSRTVATAGFPYTFEGGHQDWRASGSTGVSWDTQNSAERRMYVLAPGESMTMTAVLNIQVFANNGNATVDAWRSFVEVQGWSLAPSQVAGSRRDTT